MGRRDDEQLLRRLVAMDPRVGSGERARPDGDGPWPSLGNDHRPDDHRPDDPGPAPVTVRRRIPPAAVTGAALLCLAVAVGAGGRIALGSDGSSTSVEVDGRSQVAGPTAGTRPGTTSSAAAQGSSTASAMVGSPASSGAVVHVVGLVRRAGLVTVPPGGRVADAIVAAGGAAPGADLAALNLARPVVDGEQLVVPRPGQVVQAGPGADAERRGGAGGGGSGQSGAGGSPSGSRVDLNRADVSALDALPGIGPVMAKRIVDYRTEHGAFRSVDQLAEVPGIGERTLERLTPLVRV